MNTSFSGRVKHIETVSIVRDFFVFSVKTSIFGSSNNDDHDDHDVEEKQ